MTTEPHMQPLSSNVVADTMPPHQAGKPRLKGSAAKRARERLVLLSFGLITAAAAATCHVLFEYSLASSVLAGGGVWAVLMTMHLQVNRSAEIAHLKAELQKLEIARGGAVSTGANAIHASTDVDRADLTLQRSGWSPHDQSLKPAASTVNSEASAHTPRVTDALQNHQPQMTSDATLQGPAPKPRWEMAGANPRAMGRPASSGADAHNAEGHHPADVHSAAPQPDVEITSWPGTSLSGADPMRDQWAFRPREGSEGQAPEDYDDNAIEPQAQHRHHASSIDADLEMVQRKIKALADEVNAAELTRDRQTSPAAPEFGSAASVMEKSIGALKSTAQTMRSPAASAAPTQFAQPLAQQFSPSHVRATTAPPSASLAVTQPQEPSLPFEFTIPDTAQRIAVSDPMRTEPQLPMPTLPELAAPDRAVSPPPPNPRLAAIVAAIATGEMDVYLSPIVALQSHQVSHYDVTVRLKTAHGAYLDHAEQELQLAGSDMLALFDTARLKRAALLAQKLDARDKSGSLLSAVNGPSITNAEFLETFARVFEERGRISNQLVLTFSQADLEQFSQSAWQALSDMHAFGFRFALSKIDHVDMDFAALAKRGFAFLRLESSALTHGLPARERFIEANELCQLLAGAGMTLVADTIDDEAIRARVFGFGVLFGQGRLFGGARQVRLDALPGGASAAA